jgi:hypothetical protein
MLGTGATAKKPRPMMSRMEEDEDAQLSFPPAVSYNQYRYEAFSLFPYTSPIICVFSKTHLARRVIGPEVTVYKVRGRH